MIQKGKLIQFIGNFGSGLGFLSIEVKGLVNQYSCDNSTTVRNLESAFGNTIKEGHTADGNGYKDQEVYFSVDDFGMLVWFCPVDEAGQEIIDKYKDGGN